MIRRAVVLHLDDQPEHASWIARAINDWFWKCFRKDMRMTRRMDENDEETDFNLFLRVGDDDIEVRYQIFVDEESFYQTLANAQDVALIILDQAFNGNFEVGGNAYRYIESSIPHLIDKTVILTAYPSHTCSQLRWSVDDVRLIAKPPEKLKILDRFVGGLAAILGAAAYRQLTDAIAEERLR